MQLKLDNHYIVINLQLSDVYEAIHDARELLQLHNGSVTFHVDSISGITETATKHLRDHMVKLLEMPADDMPDDFEDAYAVRLYVHKYRLSLGFTYIRRPNLPERRLVLAIEE